MSKKIVRGIFRFGSMFLLNIWKGYERKNRPRCFQIRKYAFLKIFQTGMSKKTILVNFRFARMLFFFNI